MLARRLGRARLIAEAPGLLAVHDRRPDRGPGRRGAPGGGRRRPGQGAAVPGHCLLLPAQRRAVDGHHHRPVRAPVLRPGVADREPGHPRDLRSRRRQPEQRGPAGRARRGLPRADPAGRGARGQPGRAGVAGGGRLSPGEPDRLRPGLAPLRGQGGPARPGAGQYRRLRTATSPTRRAAPRPGRPGTPPPPGPVIRGRCSTASGPSRTCRAGTSPRPPAWRWRRSRCPRVSDSCPNRPGRTRTCPPPRSAATRRPPRSASPTARRRPPRPRSSGLWLLCTAAWACWTGSR